MALRRISFLLPTFDDSYFVYSIINCFCKSKCSADKAGCTAYTRKKSGEQHLSDNANLSLSVRGHLALLKNSFPCSDTQEIGMWRVVVRRREELQLFGSNVTNSPSSFHSSIPTNYTACTIQGQKMRNTSWWPPARNELRKRLVFEEYGL